MEMNELARRALATAKRRRQTYQGIGHKKMVAGIQAEMDELHSASPKTPSPHISWMDEETEELVDVLICCMTELRNKGVNVEVAVQAKIEYNEKRE
jgi:NTP pyrophosphatase (non-canonical NTP hydrolase)